MKHELNIANHERHHIVTVVIPILPGKAEPWRRFRQELQGSRRQAFVAWCDHLGLKVQQI